MISRRSLGNILLSCSAVVLPIKTAEAKQEMNINPVVIKRSMMTLILKVKDTRGSDAKPYKFPDHEIFSNNKENFFKYCGTSTWRYVWHSFKLDDDKSFIDYYIKLQEHEIIDAYNEACDYILMRGKYA